MSSARGGLGRGLGALFPPEQWSAATEPSADAVAAAGAELRLLAVDAIEANPRQPREVHEGDALTELAESIRAVGLLQPIVVRELPDGRYQLVMGERRWRASRLVGLTEIPAIVRWTPDDALLRDALLENLHREQLNPLEEAAAYRQLLEDFGATHEQLADRLGRSRSQVSNTVRLLNLPVAVQRRVAAGVLSAGHARALLALEDSAAQDQLATRVVAEGLSVRALEEAVAAGAGRPRRAARRPSTAPRELTAAAARLSDHFDTRVKVESTRTKGRIVVEFATVADLERILGIMAPGLAPSVGSGPTGSDAP